MSQAIAAPTAETSLGRSLRTRAALNGIALGTLALALATVAGLLIVAGPFHTDLGQLA